MADAGYDVAGYRAIEPLLGSLAEAEKLTAEAHALGIRIIIDVVPNHGSDQQPWFTSALAAGWLGRAGPLSLPARPGDPGELPPDVLCHQRGAGRDAVTVMVSLAVRPVPLRPHSEVLLSSGPLPGGLLPPDTAAWLRPPAPAPGR